ncbi:hypothetical protein C5167_004084 [Papaver somniferum]|nr:hypothetical protein C5167_004084 [Papaver somniferum]
MNYWMWIARVAININGAVNISLHRCRTRRVVVVGSCVKLPGGGTNCGSSADMKWVCCIGYDRDVMCFESKKLSWNSGDTCDSVVQRMELKLQVDVTSEIGREGVAEM